MPCSGGGPSSGPAGLWDDEVRPPVSVNIGDLGAKIMNLPTRDQIEVPMFNEALIVEHYSR